VDEAKRRLLQRMPIFGAVSGEAMGFLLDRSTRIEVPSGGWFFREGDRGGSAIVLECGRATVLKRGEDRLHPLLELGPGDCFGEVSLLDFGRRSASVRTRTARGSSSPPGTSTPSPLRTPSSSRSST
jgi:CRP/FNR family cyclic AMP-dependent transcriptional regulator